MKKVGIITLYYKNYNYGGLLQSYALQQLLQKKGYECKQICFEKKIFKSKGKKFERIFSLLEEVSIFGTLKKILNKVKEKIEYISIPTKTRKEIYLKITERNKCLQRFEESIPHTKVYDELSIGESEKIFDCFICGSDQIWKPGVNCDEYFLKFARKKKRISYAASIGRSKLSKKDLKYILDSAKELDCISLREKEAVELLKNQGLDTKLVLDPTLILDKNDWDKFIENENECIKDKYIFCYFLGSSKKQRYEVEKFAKEKNLIIVTIPFLSKKPSINDVEFGDVQLYDISPQKFIHLIKNAEYVFTDSFHATVFSGIYNKDFFVFEREDEKSMSGRIVNLLNLYGIDSRIIKNTKNITKTKKYNDIYSNKTFIELRNESIEFLLKNIG